MTSIMSTTAENGPEEWKERNDVGCDSATPETENEADDDRMPSEKWRGGGGNRAGPISPPPDNDGKDDIPRRRRLNDNGRTLQEVTISSVQQEEIVFSDLPESSDGQSGQEIRLKSPLSDPSNEEYGQAGTRLGSIDPVERRIENPPRGKSDGVSPEEEEKYDVPSDSQEEDDDDDDEDDDSNKSPKPESWLRKARMTCGKMVNNEHVQITIIILILINALMMGLSTFDFVTQNEKVSDVFNKIDRGFLVIFTVEVVMQLFYLWLALFADGWLVFDLLIVIFSWAFESLQIVRAFRIFRAFRLITRVKPLRDLVLAIGAVLPRMYAIAALLLLIFYIFSVLFTELFSDLPLSDNYFKTLDASLFTCMEMMTLEWGEIAREVMTYESWAWAPFTAFIAITGFIVFNLIVAVVCDAVAVTEKTVRELDGFEADDPEVKLTEAQERIDLLQCHIGDMLRTQQAVQEMIDLMAGELLHLEAERMKAEHREAELRIEMERRTSYQKSMESDRQIESLERNYILEKQRREAEKRMIAARRSDSCEDLEGSGKGRRSAVIVPHIDLDAPPERRRVQRRGSATSSRSGRPGMGRDSSHASIKTASSNNSSRRRGRRGQGGLTDSMNESASSFMSDLE